MTGGPHLRSVDGSSGPESGAPPPAPSDPGSRRIVWLLSITLVIALILLVWSRTQMGSRIEDLEAEAAALTLAVEERDVVIDAHQRRLGDVRATVGELAELLDAPLPEAR